MLLGKHFDPAGPAVISVANLAFTDTDMLESVDYTTFDTPAGRIKVERHATRFSKTVDFITVYRWFKSDTAQHRGAPPHFVRASGMSARMKKCTTLTEPRHQLTDWDHNVLPNSLSLSLLDGLPQSADALLSHQIFNSTIYEPLGVAAILWAPFRWTRPSSMVQRSIRGRMHLVRDQET